MNLFDVYPLMNVTPEKALGAKLWDEDGVEYLDLYGGHAVISVGHSHPHFIGKLKEQIDKMIFYSNSVQIPLQKQLAEKLGALSSYPDFNLFLCNSGSEANENALKLASFATGKSGMISFSGAFHGRTSGAVVLTDNPKIIAPCNQRNDAYILPFGDIKAVEQKLAERNIAGVIIEGIQGVGGIKIPNADFLIALRALTEKYDVKLILDEVQSGYGRTGKFFAHQWVEGLVPDLITTAKGMGNGFPIGGVLIHPDFQASYGLLGTTFGGNHLACAAALAVLEIIESENLMENALQMGDYLVNELRNIHGITEVRGKGLMIGLDLDKDASPIRSELLQQYRIFTGSSAGKQTIRLLPPLNIQMFELSCFIESLKNVLHQSDLSKASV